MSRFTLPEVLEARIAPASAVGRALDLPDSAVVDVSGTRAVGLAVGTNFAVGGLGAFPTGADNDFIVLSTGDATKAYAPRPSSYPHFGLDHGKKGAEDDLQHLHLEVPVAPGQTHIKFDFNLMTDEEPGLTNEFNDAFSVLASPNVGSAETLVQLKVNDPDIFLATAPENAIYRHHTGTFTADYRVPAGATSVTFDFYLADRPAPGLTTSGDGTGDTAVAIDNFRFTSAKQTVWLNFEGATITNMMTAGTSMQVPAFQTADISSAADRATLINTIFTNVAAKFAPYDIDFVLAPPATGSFLSMSIGGNNSNAVTLGAGADPRLTAALGTTTTTGGVLGQLGLGNGVFGMADSVDFGNASLSGNGFIHSALYATAYSGETTDVIQQRLEVTIAHEIAHALGAAHLDDSFDANIMAQFSPRSPTATFEDTSRTLVNPNPDGRTAINVHEYLQGVLGSSTESVFVNGFSVALSKQIIRLILNSPLFNFHFGVVAGADADAEDGEADGTVQWFSVGNLQAGENEIEIPNFGTETQVTFYGSTTSGGPVDFFSGTPNAGDMTAGDGFVPLFDVGGAPVATLPAAQGTLGGGLSEVNGGLGFGFSTFTTAGLIPIPAKGGFVFTQADGDIVTVKLGSKVGAGSIALTPDGNDIARIELQGTGSKDSLSITVKRKGDGPDTDKLPDGDGSVNIGTIVGGLLGSLTAKTADLTGAGLQFGGAIGSVTLRDIENGADVLLGGTFSTKTSLATRAIADGSTIDVDGQLKLTSAKVGAGTIETAALISLAVKGDKAASLLGDFESDITIVPGKTLSEKEAKQNLLGAVNVAGRVIDVDIFAPGHAGAFKTGTFEHSSLFLGYAPTMSATPLAGGLFNGGDFKLASFTAKGIKDSLLPAYDDSVVVAARLGAISLASLDTDNGGIAFGFGARLGIEKNIAAIVVKAPEIKLNSKSTFPHVTGDFNVITLGAIPS